MTKSEKEQEPKYKCERCGCDIIDTHLGYPVCQVCHQPVE